MSSEYTPGSTSFLLISPWLVEVLTQTDMILPVENNDIMAFKAGGCSKATCKPLNPPHDFPYIPTDPLLQGWEEIQARKYAKKDYPFTK